MISSAGVRRTATSTAFGNYHFDGVGVGQTYTISVLARRWQFTPQIVVVDDEITGLDFRALPN
jgi:hypothetical protein